MKSCNLRLLNPLACLIFGILAISASTARAEPKPLDHLVLSIDRKVLNPLHDKTASGKLTLTGYHQDGSHRTIPFSSAILTAKTRSASGNVQVVDVQGDRVFAREGGTATVEATLLEGGRSLKASTDVVVAPFFRDYHQTLVLKLFLGMEGDPVDRLAKEPMFQKEHDVGVF